MFGAELISCILDAHMVEKLTGFLFKCVIFSNLNEKNVKILPSWPNSWLKIDWKFGEDFCKSSTL